jgi:acetolactate synthase-1/3 small subunit
MSSYDSDTEGSQQKTLPYRILSVIVDNKPGVLFRVTNLFRARNFNIESITVGTTEQQDISRMTIAIQSDSRTTDQLVKQLSKLIDIIEVRILDTGNTVFRELALIKMKAHNPTSRMEITHFSNIFRAKILDVSKDSMMVEITGTPDKIDAFKSIVDPYGIIQIARTGISALPRGV